ncbi:L-fucose mutarotase/ribose pyranase (RbsD/FucU family) [Bradyrhizobium sp. USDA 4354]
MLKSIYPIRAPELLWLIASMGQGHDLVAVDAYHPATRIAAAALLGVPDPAAGMSYGEDGPRPS